MRTFPWVPPSTKIAQQQGGETTHDAFPLRDAGKVCYRNAFNDVQTACEHFKDPVVGCLNMHGSVTEQITEVTLTLCCIPTETRDKHQFCGTAAVKRYKKPNTVLTTFKTFYNSHMTSWKNRRKGWKGSMSTITRSTISIVLTHLLNIHRRDQHPTSLPSLIFRLSTSVKRNIINLQMISTFHILLHFLRLDQRWKRIADDAAFKIVMIKSFTLYFCYIIVSLKSNS